MEKLSGRKPSILLSKKKPAGVKSIYKYKVKTENINVLTGFEYILLVLDEKKPFSCKLKYSRNQEKKESTKRQDNKKCYLGRIMARNSSDLIATLAKRVIKDYSNKTKLSSLKLIQYPLSKNDNTKKLLVLIGITDKTAAFDEIELILNEIFLSIRKKLQIMVDSAFRD
ncbi:MAG: hypothetical protein GF364_01100 [Candidatus Lokiarchaeota archaeon]|nr:hypothetical protein [Candidatus Lokiarchaeota archaeon]